MYCSSCGRATAGGGRCLDCGAPAALPGEGDLRSPWGSVDLPLEGGPGSRAPTLPFTIGTDLDLDRRRSPREAPVLAAIEPSDSASGAHALAHAPRRIDAAVRWLEEAGRTDELFRRMGETLLANPLDPRPVPALERRAAATAAEHLLAGLYEALLEARPDHPSRETLLRRIERLRGAAASREVDEPSGPPAEVPAGPDLPWNSNATTDGPRPGSLRDEVDELDLRSRMPTLTGMEVEVDLGAAPIGLATLAESLEARIHPERDGEVLAAKSARDAIGDDAYGETIEAELHGEPMNDAGLYRESIDAEMDAESIDAELYADSIDAELGSMIARADSGDRAPSSHVAVTLRRMAAWVVDGALLATASATILLLATGSVRSVASLAVGHPLGAGQGGSVASIALAAAIAFVYLTLCWSLGGRTLGGALVRLRAVDRESGAPLAIGQAAVRALFAIAGTLAFLAGPLWAVVDGRGEALHDKLARSSVVPA